MDEIHETWRTLYVESKQSNAALEELLALLKCGIPTILELRKTERDALLIAYPDHITGREGTAIDALNEFCRVYAGGAFSSVHVLPFYEADGDFGFAVLNHTCVDIKYGDTSDLLRLSGAIDVCADLVLNHVSLRHTWVERFLAGDEQVSHFFIETDDQFDIESITGDKRDPRVRQSRRDGSFVNLWTRYGPGQLDLNYREPKVLVEMVKVLLWLARQGVRWVRLDALPFIWKESGTDCSHRPEVLGIAKILRRALDACAPHVRLIAEVDFETQGTVYLQTAKVSAVYDLALPALLSHAFVAGGAELLADHFRRRPRLEPGTTCLNPAFTHDGLFLRPYSPILPEVAQAALIDRVRERGGTVRFRHFGDDLLAYECNIALASLIGEPCDTPERSAQRMACLVGIVAAAPGTPAIYLNVLLCAENDAALVRKTEDPRAINRRTFCYTSIDQALSDDTPAGWLQRYLRTMLTCRRGERAFDPCAEFALEDCSESGVLAFWRGEREVLCIFNLSGLRRRQPLAAGPHRDILTGHFYFDEGILEAYQFLWLVRDAPKGNIGRIEESDQCFPVRSASFYAERALELQPGVGHRLDESYCRNHLPLVAPNHPDVINVCSETDYRRGRYRKARVSLIAMVPAAIVESAAYFKWLTAVKSSPIARKIAWNVHRRRRNRLHATICGRLNLHLGADEIDMALEKIARIPAFSVRGLAPWIGGNRNNGRIYIPLVPERRSDSIDNHLHSVQMAAGQTPSDLLVLGLLQLTDHLDCSEASALRDLLRSPNIEDKLFDFRLDEVALIETYDDLILDSVVLERVPLRG